MTTIDTELTLEDVSSISARYLFSLAPADSDTDFSATENAGDIASQLLKDYVEKAMDQSISGEMLVYRIFQFAECLTMATMTESPPAALETTSDLFATFVKDLEESAKDFKRPSFYAKLKERTGK